MVKRILYCITLIAALTALVPSVASAAPPSQPGSSPDNPALATYENGALAFDMETYTLYGLNEQWVSEQRGSADTLYVALQIPRDTEVIAPYSFSAEAAPDKTPAGVASRSAGCYEISSVDFSCAEYLRTIEDHAFYGCANMTGDIGDLRVSWDLLEIGDYAFHGCGKLTGNVSFNANHGYNGQFRRIGSYAFYGCAGIASFDMSLAASSLKEIGAFAFCGCTGLERFVWPSYGPEKIGESAFEGCTGLRSVACYSTKDPAEGLLEIPYAAKQIDKRAFKDCFAQDVQAFATIPRQTWVLGPECFASDRIRQITVEKEGRAGAYRDYPASAFETGNPDTLLIFPDKKSYDGFLEQSAPPESLERRMTFPASVTLKDGEGKTTVLDKLYAKPLSYENRNGLWAPYEDFALPELDQSRSTPGYSSKWVSKQGAVLTAHSLVNEPAMEAAPSGMTLDEPSIMPKADGIPMQEPFSKTSVFRFDVALDGKRHTVGVDVEHPLELGDGKHGSTDTEYVYFKYCWWDEVESRAAGPRSSEEPGLFSSDIAERVMTESDEIPVFTKDHERTEGGYYMVEIYGYHVDADGNEDLFYKSHYNFIDFNADRDTEATTGACYFFNVAVSDHPHAHFTDPTGSETPPVPPAPGTSHDSGSAGTGDDGGVSGILETEKHFAFFNGYPDGAFGPDRAITRGEAAQVFFNLLREKDARGATPFTDVAAGSWYERPIAHLHSLGILEGVGGGLFEPDRAITRAEFAAMATRFARDETSYEQPPFPDVLSGDWHFGAVSEAAARGWIEGYPDGSFRPNDAITRAETAAVVERMLGRSADKAFVDANGGKLRAFSDMDASHWSYYVVAEAANRHAYRKTGEDEVWSELIGQAA